MPKKFTLNWFDEKKFAWYSSEFLVFSVFPPWDLSAKRLKISVKSIFTLSKLILVNIFQLRVSYGLNNSLMQNEKGRKFRLKRISQSRKKCGNDSTKSMLSCGFQYQTLIWLIVSAAIHPWTYLISLIEGARLLTV